MADIITFFEENGLFNTIGCDSIVYYDRNTHEFVVFSAEDDVRSDDLIETPYTAWSMITLNLRLRRY